MFGPDHFILQPVHDSLSLGFSSFSSRAFRSLLHRRTTTIPAARCWAPAPRLPPASSPTSLTAPSTKTRRRRASLPWCACQRPAPPSPARPRRRKRRCTRLTRSTLSSAVTVLSKGRLPDRPLRPEEPITKTLDILEGRRKKSCTYDLRGRLLDSQAFF